MDYAEFGAALICAAVSPQRVADAVARVAGDTVEIGPIDAGPGGRATVTARGRIGTPRAEQVAADPLAYRVRLPVDIDLEVQVGSRHRYDATGAVDLQLQVHTVEPLSIAIEVQPVQPGHVSFRVGAKGLQARILQKAGDVDGELRRHAAEYVNHKVHSPDAARYLLIDLLPVIDQVWADL